MHFGDFLFLGFLVFFLFLGGLGGLGGCGDKDNHNKDIDKEIQGKVITLKHRIYVNLEGKQIN